MENLVDDDLKQRLSDESGNESDNDSSKSLLVCINHALLGFYLRQYVQLA